MKSVITPQMHAAIGSRINRRVSYPVTTSDIRRWVLAVYWPEQPPQRYMSAREGLVAPEDLNPFAWAAAHEELHPTSATIVGNDPDRTEKQLDIDGPGLRHQLNGGIASTYGEPIRAGDVITAVRTLSGYTEREGRLGHMLLTTTEDTWTNQRGELVRRTEFTLIRY